MLGNHVRIQVKTAAAIIVSFIITVSLSNSFFRDNSPIIQWSKVHAPDLSFLSSLFTPPPHNTSDGQYRGTVKFSEATPPMKLSPSVSLKVTVPLSSPTPIRWVTAIPSPTLSPTTRPSPAVMWPTSTPAPTAVQSVSCPTTSGEHYASRPLSWSDAGAESNPDTVLSLKGWELWNGKLELVTYGYPKGEPPDPNAPKLSSLLGNGPMFSHLYQIYHYNPAHYREPPHLAGLSARPGQEIHAPSNGYDIGGGYQYTVVFASPNELTMNVTDGDGAIDGYAIHLVDICVDPSLVALYRQLHSQGRRQMPVLKSGQKVGVAKNTEVKVAIRDSGSYLDPRSKLDWWQ